MESTRNPIALRRALDAPLSELVKLDTKNICDLVNREITAHGISQQDFAEKVLGRSQGTLSDLLKNPKPWDELKSGRNTYVRMYNWVQMSPEDRTAVLNDSTAPPKRKSTAESGPIPKRTRLVFNEIQRQTLEQIYEETSKPEPRMQKTIAEQLNLSVSTVHNYFQNRRTRHQRAARKAEQNQNSVEEKTKPETTNAPGSPETSLNMVEYQRSYLKDYFERFEYPSNGMMQLLARNADLDFETTQKFLETLRQARQRNGYGGENVSKRWDNYYNSD